VRGEGWFLCDGERHRFGPGDFLLAPAGVVHRFEEFTANLAVWVLFYGAVGGESSL
jgi:quercetin dioxygenase-like cupin family protein